MKRDNFSAARIYLSAFVSGAAVMILEIMGTRLLEPFLSNSVFTWIGMISVMLTCLSIGYFLGGKLADRNPSTTYVALLFILSGISIAVIPLYSYQVLSFSSNFGLIYGPIIASSLLFSLPSILLAMISPYLIKLNAKELRVIGEIFGNIYAISTVGSIFGTLLAGFYILPNIGIKATLLSLSMILIVDGALFLGKKGVLPVMLGLVVNLAVPQPMNFKPSSGILLYENYSAYQYLSVVDLPEKQLRVIPLWTGEQTAIYLNSTDIPPGYPRYQKLIYAFRPAIKKALFIGLGGGVMPKDMRKNSEADITIVEIDPAVVYVAKKFFNFSEDEKMRVEIGDARLFIANSDEKYDYIMIDAYLSPIFPFHLATAEFLESVKQHLSSDGIVFTNVLSSIEGEKSELFKSVYKTYKSKFRNVYVLPGNDLNLSKSSNIVILATDANLGDREDFISYVSKFGSKDAVEPAHHYYNGTVNDSSAPLLTDDFCPVDMEGLRSLK